MVCLFPRKCFLKAWFRTETYSTRQSWKLAYNMNHKLDLNLLINGVLISKFVCKNVSVQLKHHSILLIKLLLSINGRELVTEVELEVTITNNNLLFQ